MASSSRNAFHPRRRGLVAASLAGVLMGTLALPLLAGERTGQGVLPDAAARLTAYQPFDGTGRYRLDQTDGIREIQGLVTLAARDGLKPYELLGRDGRWQTERVIFTDVTTGATIYRLTADLFADELSYFRGNVSADGSTVVFRRRPGMWESSTATHGPMAMNADGSGLRNVFRSFRLVRKHATSFTDPTLCFAIAEEKKIVAFDVRTGQVVREIADIKGCWWLKVSPDGRYVMGRGPIGSGQNGIYIYSIDGKERFEVAIPEAIHDSYQFHPTLRKMMYWVEGKFRTEGFVQRDFDGSNLAKVNVQFDWNHGDCGIDRGAHTEGYITRIDGNTWKPMEWLVKADAAAEYYDDPADANGYLAWRPKDELWAFGTRIVAQPSLSEVFLMALEPVAGDVANRFRICYTNLHRKAALDNPEASPDGTRVYFNSTMLGSCSVYMAIARKPSPPTGVKAEWTSEGVSIAWSAPKHHAEIKGYRVYRSDESGRGYHELAKMPVAETKFFDVFPPTSPLFYVVTSEEHSGPESLPSAEIGTALRPADMAAKAVRIYIEAESGSHGPAVWRAFDGTASDLYFVWNRKRGQAGKVAIPVSIPRDGRYRAWVRARVLDGSAGASPSQIKLSAGASQATGKAEGRAWAWAPLEGELVLKQGQCTLDLDLAQYGAAADVVYLSTVDSSPTDGPRLPGFDAAVAVTGLKAEPLGPFAVRLSWNPVKDGRLSHYNLYVSTRDDFQPDRATLVASPDKAEHIDWSLSPGTGYTYRVAAVDRNGTEIVSPPARVTTAVLAVQKIELPYEKDKPVDFEVAQDGQYVVWLKLTVAKGEGSYLELALDATRKATWTVQPDHLTDETWYRYNEFAVFPLTKGRHRLALANKTPHTVQKILVTNDLSFSPPGHINMPTGW